MFNKPIWIVLLSAFVSCNLTPDTKDNEFIIQGTFANADQCLLVFEELSTSANIFIDSVYTKPDGSFLIRQPIQDAAFYVLRVDDKNSITLLIEPGEDLEITGDANELVSSYLVDGSVGSALLSELAKAHLRNVMRVDSLVQVFRDQKNEPNFEATRQLLMQAYEGVFDNQQEYVKTFIEANPNSLASVIALYQYFGSKLLLRESEHFDYFESLSKSLTSQYPCNKHVMDLKRRVIEYKRTRAQRMLAEENLTPGNMAPEIILPDTAGNNIALSSMRGNIVLIDFWAAWCPPCRQANRYLKRIYDEYHEKGFEIYGVSLDRTHDQWILGIREDEINWTQVSDLRFWSSPVASLYNVESIPYTVLIDRNGKIIGKGMNTRDIRRKLEELLP
jgi:peroxiredoxin